MIPVRLIAYGAAAAIVVAVAHFTPVVGYGAQLHRIAQNRDAWRVAADDWKDAASGWEKSFRKSERLRAEENVQARAAVNETALQCDARVKQARASAKVIREILDRPVKVKDGCPVRGVVGADDLGRALGAR
jgi:hypothetical protein